MQRNKIRIRKRLAFIDTNNISNNIATILTLKKGNSIRLIECIQQNTGRKFNTPTSIEDKESNNKQMRKLMLKQKGAYA